MWKFSGLKAICYDSTAQLNSGAVISRVQTVRLSIIRNNHCYAICTLAFAILLLYIQLMCILKPNFTTSPKKGDGCIFE